MTGHIKTIDSMRLPAYWGLPENMQFSITRGGMQGNRPCAFADLMDYLDACGFDLGRDEATVAAIISGTPFEIDNASIVFRQIRDDKSPIEELMAADDTGTPTAAMPAPAEVIDIINPEQLASILRHLRKYGFAMMYHGGEVLHQSVGAPTADISWQKSLGEVSESLAGGNNEAAWRIASAIEDSLFDLNRTGDAGVAVAKSIIDLSSKV